MHRLMLLASIVGCEQIEPSGNPLQPVQVTAAAPTAVPVHVVDAPAVVEDEDDVLEALKKQ